ncbi:MAG: hypothetical protein DMG87_17415, partial [Acidobacteria bacterium]
MADVNGDGKLDV